MKFILLIFFIFTHTPLRLAKAEGYMEVVDLLNYDNE